MVKRQKIDHFRCTVQWHYVPSHRLGSRRHHPSPELCHLPKLKPCTRYTVTPYCPVLPLFLFLSISKTVWSLSSTEPRSSPNWQSDILVTSEQALKWCVTGPSDFSLKPEDYQHRRADCHQSAHHQMCPKQQLWQPRHPCTHRKTKVMSFSSSWFYLYNFPPQKRQVCHS